MNGTSCKNRESINYDYSKYVESNKYIIDIVESLYTISNFVLKDQNSLKHLLEKGRFHEYNKDIYLYRNNVVIADKRKDLLISDETDNISYNDEIKVKIEKRIEDLLESSIEDELDKDNVSMSQSNLESFLEKVEFYEYPKGIGLDDNGYFTLEIDRDNYYALFIFRKELNFYYYENEKLRLSMKTEYIEDFFKNINNDILIKLFNHSRNN